MVTQTPERVEPEVGGGHVRANDQNVMSFLLMEGERRSYVTPIWMHYNVK